MTTGYEKKKKKRDRRVIRSLGDGVRVVPMERKGRSTIDESVWSLMFHKIVHIKCEWSQLL